MIPPGDNYAYIITDENNRIEKVILESSYDFEGSGIGINRVFGVSYDGTLNYSVGNPLTSITADGCAILSDNNTFLTVTKEICKADIIGSVTNQLGEGLANFEITLNNNLTSRTAEDGSYTFTDVPTNIGYEIAPKEDTPFKTGVTVFDIVLVRKHILGSEPFVNAYQSIAADANNDGRISTIDLLELQKLVLGISQTFTNNQSWRFVTSAAIQNGDLDPFDFAESITIDNLTNDVTGIDFIGVKVGDVSSVRNGGLLQGESRSNHTLQFRTTDAFLEAGQTIEIPISAENFEQIIGYQFTMNLENLSFIDVKAGALAVNKNNFAQLEDQIVTTIWTNETPVSTEQTLFTLVVEVLADIQLSEALIFDASVTPALAYQASTKSMDVDLGFAPIQAATANINTQLLQNTPNPFYGETIIGFQLAKAGPITLQVFDATGRNIITKNGDYEQGIHQIRLTDLDNLPAGLLYYQLSTADFQATKKMIRGQK